MKIQKSFSLGFSKIQFLGVSKIQNVTALYGQCSMKDIYASALER